MDFHAPYLEAIQAIPGSTAEEKFRWIAKVIKERLSACETLEEVVESESIPRPLAPLIQVEAAKILNKKNLGDQSNYEAIAEALKSEDLMVVNRALQARNFFNGTNKSITNVQYFFDHLFPFVSLDTRTRIVKVLALQLAQKEPHLAEDFFTAITLVYGIDQALPLLPACSKTFAYEMIVSHNIVLSQKLVKVLFRKDPDFVVRYLKLSKPSRDPYARNLHHVNIYDYSDFLQKLIKKRLQAFVELYEMHEEFPPAVRLSNKCAEAFLKNGKEHLQRKPLLYIKLLPLRMINASLMESIFPKLFPKKINECDTDQMLNYLEFYPLDKKVSLFIKTYEHVYGRNVLENPNNVTDTLMRLLPADERIRLARTNISSTTNNVSKWRRYLPVQEALPQIKEEILKTSEMERRAILLSEMIDSCKINSDDTALLEVLTYVRDRHKNEQPWFLLKVIDTLLNLYDTPQLSEGHWTVLMDIIRRAHVTNQLLPANSISMRILEAALHFNLIHDESIDQIIDIIVDIKSMRYNRTWNVLQKYPEYERRCLEACLNVASRRYNSDKTPWKEDKVGILYDLVASIYDFNARHVKRNSRIEGMSIKNYSWLLNEVETIIAKKEQDNVYVIENLKDIFARHEKDLYDRLWVDKKENIELHTALALLKRSPQTIMEKWKDYLKWCQDDWHRVNVKSFVKAIRWYNDIPIRFVEQCVQDILQKKSGAPLCILAVLLHGHTFARFIEPLIPIDKTIAVNDDDAKINYNLVCYIPDSTKYANPPVPLELIGRMCEGDYLSMVLGCLTNLCRRTPLPKVIPFAKTLTGKRVSVRKHGIRLMHMVAPRDQLQDFILTQWRTEEHHSIREVLLSRARLLFRGDPAPVTWSLLNQMIRNLTLKDSVAMRELLTMISTTPDAYIVEFITLLLDAIDNLSRAGLAQPTVSMYTSSLLKNINAAICNLLPEHFTEMLVRRFLFHSEECISRSAGTFVVTAYLLPAKENLETRMKMFSNVFMDVVKTGWNVAHPKNSRFFPVNHAVRRFIDDLIHTILYVDLDPRLIDGMLKTFLEVLKPEMDATSYLLLVFAQKQATVKTAKEFGKKLGETLPELVAIFSPAFLSFITNRLQYFLDSKPSQDCDREEINLDIMDGLLDVGSTHANLMAVEMLSPLESVDLYAHKYDAIIRRFREIDHPAIKGFLYDNINKTSEN